MNKNYVVALSILCAGFQVEAMYYTGKQIDKILSSRAKRLLGDEEAVYFDWWQRQYGQLREKQRELLKQNISCTELSDKEYYVVKTLSPLFMVNKIDPNTDIIHGIDCSFSCTLEHTLKLTTHHLFIRYLTEKDWTVEKALQLSIVAAQEKNKGK